MEFFLLPQLAAAKTVLGTRTHKEDERLTLPESLTSSARFFSSLSMLSMVWNACGKAEDPFLASISSCFRSTCKAPKVTRQGHNSKAHRCPGPSLSISIHPSSNSMQM